MATLASTCCPCNIAGLQQALRVHAAREHAAYLTGCCSRGGERGRTGARALKLRRTCATMASSSCECVCPRRPRFTYPPQMAASCGALNSRTRSCTASLTCQRQGIGSL